MPEPLLLLHLTLSLILLNLLFRSWLWWRYRCFTAMIVADLLKYSLWSFYQPENYIVASAPVVTFKALAAAEAVWRSIEFVALKGKLSLIGLTLAVGCIGAALGLGAQIDVNEIWRYRIVRLALHMAEGVGLLLFVVAWRLKKWPMAEGCDLRHALLLGSLCLAHAITASIGWLAPGVDDDWIILAAFRGTRLGIYYGWLRLFYGVCPRNSASSRAIRFNTSESR